jgi:AraC family transcriptional regulator, transcriptional activator of the genes for pyochelin and ferripyochelin receptors
MKLTVTEHSTLGKIHDHISANFLESIGIKELCTLFSISETKLTQGFRTKYGTTIYGYYLNRKMHYARELLKKGAHVHDVAATLNYKDVSSFIRAFKKVFPRSPGAYRFES